MATRRQPEDFAERYKPEKIISTAFLQEHTLRIPTMHDLEDLLAIVTQQRPEWMSLRSDRKYLNEFAVAFRYPGEDVVRQDVERAKAACTRIREVVREALNDANQLRLT